MDQIKDVNKDDLTELNSCGGDLNEVDRCADDLSSLEISHTSSTPDEETEEKTLKQIINCPEWKGNNKHIFILSSAGKPVYSRYGSEDKLATLFGVMQALVSFVQDNDDTIESIHFGEKLLVFSVKGPIILVAVSHKKDSVSFLSNQLTYVHNQIISVLTLSRVNNIFEKRRNYDLRRLLSGSERLIDHLLTFSETQPEFLMNAVSCLILTPPQRDSISNAIVTSCCKIKNLVFAILIGENKLITLVRKKKFNIQPSDLHLILNMISSSESFKTAESWTPICLPTFNASGFLHCHVSYLTEECQACLLLLTVEQDMFYELSEAKQKITEKLLKNQCIAVINQALKKPVFTLNDFDKIPHVRHFIYKCKKSSNLLSPAMGKPYDTLEGSQELLHQYQQLYSMIHEPGCSLTLIFQQFPEETMLGWVTDKFELMVTLDPLVMKTIATDAAKKLSQQIEKDEDKYFLQNIPYF